MISPQAALLLGAILAVLLGLILRAFSRERHLRISAERMARRASDELEAQSSRLDAIHKVANALAEAVELPELLGQGLERVVQALGLDGGLVCLSSNDEDRVMSLSAVFGDHARVWDGEQSIEIGECICGAAAAESTPIMVDDATSAPRTTGRPCAADGLPSVASVPLKAKGGNLGVLTVRSCNPHHFALHDVELLSTVANFMAAAIENARIRAEMESRIAELAEQVRQLAIVQERERLSREMHDGLAQTLSLLNVQIELVKASVRTADWTAAENELALLDTYVANAHNDVRHALGGLRQSQPKGETFLAALEDEVAGFGQRHGVEAALLVPAGIQTICLSPSVEVQLQRVIQEALANVRQHAAAGRLLVQIRENARGWCVSISDDGVGFELDRVLVENPQRYGLQTMRERVESFGGELRITSHVGEGTEVLILVPCEPAGEG